MRVLPDKETQDRHPPCPDAAHTGKTLQRLTAPSTYALDAKGNDRDRCPGPEGWRGGSMPTPPQRGARSKLPC